ncbi:MAG TPA: pyrroloquinoline quinone biosynthesis peptide chaperone PqqD [Candidatus Acidoferrales bacterium]|nr:pyrroloquinoline quinone biosynthesis peptide chaperone PqqD [Candidatus Acidoferrales bacterium]
MSAENLRFAPGVRLRRENERVAFLLVPEGVVELSPSAAAIAELIDGEHTLDSIAQTLAERFDAPAGTLHADVAEFCESLRERGHVIAG